MDFRQLRYFVAVAELGSFSAAARHLHVAQPALSRHVKALEERLGVPLLKRSVRGVQMTPAGENVFHAAKGILRQVERLPEIVDDEQSLISGRVVIGLPTSVSAILGAPLLQTARSRYPLVELHLIDLASGFLEPWLQMGRLDICVVYDAMRNAKLRVDDMLVEDLCLVGPPDAFPQTCNAIRFAALAKYPLTLPSAPHSMRRVVTSMADALGVRLNVVLEVDSLTVQKVLAREGQALMISTQAAVREDALAGSLRAVRINEPALTRQISLATLAHRGETRACDEIRRLALSTAHHLVRSGAWMATAADSLREEAIPR